MRRSKSNPAKYTKHYRSISQRRMTAHDSVNEEQEMERLRQFMRDNQVHLHDDDTLATKKRPRQESNSPEKEDYEGILSKEMIEEMGDTQDAVILSKPKKKRKKHKQVELSPQELKQAKQLHKKAARKLQQLEQRAAQKKKRAELYTKLQETALDQEKMKLLHSSSTLGQKATLRQQLQRLLQKERAGIELTIEEQAVLYKDRTVIDEVPLETPDNHVEAETKDVKQPSKKSKRNQKTKDRPDQEIESKRRQNEYEIENRTTAATDTTEMDTSTKNASAFNSATDESVKREATEESQTTKKKSDADTSISSNVSAGAPAAAMSTAETTSAEESKAKPQSFAAQMMASLSRLKTESTMQSEKMAKEREQAEREQREQEEKANQPKVRYVPSDPIVLKATTSRGINPKEPTKSQRKVKEIQRPEDVKASRYELPVAGMEFEVMDAIRNNEVTIICSETGSGKSTQVPQMLYESGMTVSNDDKHFCIGVTQPRRVAAVSTAKRVCYEMGQGNGRSIPNGKEGKGNLVAYQTRYETAGIGSETHIKFMTDGILLQEIQSDLLLRKYSVILLDESHERNLNTDVLIGLLSVALPLRKQAAKEVGSGLVPLKLVIMSATLRVEDFTSNKNLFPSTVPCVIKIPGRTHPVTIHHSKVTELDDYEEVAFQKVCKIHRKLPQGGILVFLTGKQEIVRMVQRLRRALDSAKGKSRSVSLNSTSTSVADVSPADAVGNEGPRDMDDDEIDGEMLRSDVSDDHDDVEENDDALEEATSNTTEPSEEEGKSGPDKVLVLPLYSMLAGDEQAKVFGEVPEGHRLIVVSTNIAETSITIPGISYVVDTGRQKCRNFSAGTGVASYDIMWISKAAADQRAGRAGRTGPGHCYRLYSSSMYARHMDAFALPEILTRPLEDVVLAMKAMKISNVADFPFPTSPERSQIDAALKLLGNIGCVDLSMVEQKGGDGEATPLGAAVAKLPLGVRYGKILLVAAEAGVLDYAIAMVAALSEANPFLLSGQTTDPAPTKSGEASDSEEEERNELQVDSPGKKQLRRWTHKGGDVLARMLAVGAYTYAGRGAGGASEKLACKKFCEENGLNPVVMQRIQKMRSHLARLCKTRLSRAEGVAAKKGGILSSMAPPNKLQERLLKQAITSGLLDNVAMLAPVGAISGDYPFSLRSAYLSCSSNSREPLLMDINSVVYSRDFRQLPQWICFDTLVRKTLKDGTSITTMKNITPIEEAWLGSLARGSRLLKLGEPLPSPLPVYDKSKDAILCSVLTKFGSHGWEVTPVKTEMFGALQTSEARHSAHFQPDDSFRWFARFLLEGRVLLELKDLETMLTDNPALITRRTPSSKVALLVSALSNAGIDSAAALRKHWSEVDNKFLFKYLKSWIKADRAADAKKLWIDTVKRNVRQWEEEFSRNSS